MASAPGSPRLLACSSALSASSAQDTRSPFSQCTEAIEAVHMAASAGGRPKA